MFNAWKGNNMKIKLMSFNIQHGRNHNLEGDVIDLPFMARTILENAPDFVGLQEVRCGTAKNYADQPEILADITGGKAYFGKNIEFGESMGYGNAVISRLPVADWSNVHIPDPKIKAYNGYYESRGIMKMTVQCGEKSILMLVSHFGLNPDEHENAVDTVLDIVSKYDGPVILMGDLNMSPEAKPLKCLSAVLKDAAAELQNEEFTFPSDDPKVRIDYFWYRGVQPVAISTYKPVVSDHCPVIAEFKV